VTATGLRLTTADRSFGAGLTGALERGELHGPIRLDLRGAAGQSFGAFAGPGVELRLVGQANDYVAKGLSGGSVTVVPEPDPATEASSEAIAGNTVLYGATAGRLHLVGRAGMQRARGVLVTEDGEPFEQLIRSRQFLPNPVSRFCTVASGTKICSKQ
jgi:glutamate synthase domain-containing protein 3